MKKRILWVGLLAIVFFLLGASSSKTPILRGILQSNLDGGGFSITNLSRLSTGGVTNLGLTASRIMMSDGGKAETSAAASGSVPVDADGSATTFSQVNALAPGAVVTNGYSLPMVFSNQVAISSGFDLVNSNGLVRLTNTSAANLSTTISNAGSVYLTNGSGYTTIVGGSQTNSGNIKSATLHATGNATIVGSVTAGGDGGYMSGGQVTAWGGGFLGFSGTGQGASGTVRSYFEQLVNGTMILHTNLSAMGTIAATNGLIGHVAAAVAASGIVGEVLSSKIASGSAVSLTTATAANITSISLTAGDWDVSGNISFAGSTATYTGSQGAIHTTSATLPTDGTEVYSGAQFTALSVTDGLSIPAKQINVSSTTVVYLIGQATFSAGTMTGYGSIRARRVR